MSRPGIEPRPPAWEASTLEKSHPDSYVNQQLQVQHGLFQTEMSKCSTKLLHVYRHTGAAHALVDRHVQVHNVHADRHVQVQQGCCGLGHTPPGTAHTDMQTRPGTAHTDVEQTHVQGQNTKEQTRPGATKAALEQTLTEAAHAVCYRRDTSKGSTV